MYARLAQSVEHQTFNLRVAGSSPSSGVPTILGFLTMINKYHNFRCYSSNITLIAQSAMIYRVQWGASSDGRALA